MMIRIHLFIYFFNMYFMIMIMIFMMLYIYLLIIFRKFVIGNEISIKHQDNTNSLPYPNTHIGFLCVTLLVYCDIIIVYRTMKLSYFYFSFLNQRNKTFFDFRQNNFD